MGEPLDYAIDDFMTGGASRRARESSRGRASHYRSGVVASETVVPTGGVNPLAPGRRGDDFGVPNEERARSNARKIKARSEYANHISNWAIVNRFNRRAVDGRITFDSDANADRYRNLQAEVMTFQDHQANCDRGIQNDCTAVGRLVGDGKNPITNSIAREELFGFSAEPTALRENDIVVEVDPVGRIVEAPQVQPPKDPTRDQPEDPPPIVRDRGARPAITKQPTKTPVVRPVVQRPEPQPPRAPVPPRNPVPPRPSTVPEPIVPDTVPEPPPTGSPFVDAPGSHHSSHEGMERGDHTGGHINEEDAIPAGRDGSANTVRQEIVDLHENDISTAGRGETQADVKRFLQNLKATQNPFLEPYKKKCFTPEFYNDNVRIH